MATPLLHYTIDGQGVTCGICLERQDGLIVCNIADVLPHDDAEDAARELVRRANEAIGYQPNAVKVQDRLPVQPTQRVCPTRPTAP